MSDFPVGLPSLNVRLELVDANSSAPIQAWIFEQRARISVGRSPDQDIAIPDLAVSRQHVQLELQPEGWRLTSLGRHGVIIEGRPVQAMWLGEECWFRLGPTGPMLHFQQILDPDTSAFSLSNGQDTMISMQLQVLQLEDLATHERDEKVEEIVNSDFFSMIKDKARKLRLPQ